MTDLPKNHRPGSHWRILAHELDGSSYGEPIEDDHEHRGPSEFDELVVDEWLHLEQLDKRLWYMRLGPLLIHVTVGERGRAKQVSVTCDEDGYEHTDDMDSYSWRSDG